MHNYEALTLAGLARMEGNVLLVRGWATESHGESDLI